MELGWALRGWAECGQEHQHPLEDFLECGLLLGSSPRGSGSVGPWWDLRTVYSACSCSLLLITSPLLGICNAGIFSQCPSHFFPLLRVPFQEKRSLTLIKFNL